MGNPNNQSSGQYGANEDADLPHDSKSPRKHAEHHVSDEWAERPSNEFVLNVAFFSFLGFTLLQTGFAISAKSQAMLADSEAMFVDALTYLFNLMAERLKHRPYTEEEKRLPAADRHYRRKLHRLYLELIPPFISVTTLAAVTVLTLHDALQTLLGEKIPSDASDEPNINIMMFFSALNLVLDVVNVSYFARADQAIGLVQGHNHVEHHHTSEHRHTSEHHHTSEQSPLVLKGSKQAPVSMTDSDTDDDDAESDGSGSINLNMCSAWTHVCADTLRSIAVLVTAGISFVWDIVTPEAADAMGAVIVSFIIMFSLGPLVQGLYYTAVEIRVMTARGHAPVSEFSIIV